MTKSKPKAEAATPMDPSVREESVGAPATRNQRTCYAAKTLVAEVQSLFPETPVEYSNYDGRNTALDVTFDVTSMDSEEAASFLTLMGLLDDPAHNEDIRIREVLVEDGQVLVGFKSNPRTQDSREPFGLADALAVLNGDAS